MIRLRRRLYADMATGQPIGLDQWVAHPYGGHYRLLYVQPVLGILPLLLGGQPMAIVERCGGPRPGFHRVCVRYEDGDRCTIMVNF